ncbi:uncharacterized protein LOC127136278 [Lathyrus oleraceus]|uniref:uncharacterized protein LOC127136278 n=1 Tax=Pisum sativum TaxID=3888 RepID=UPI0021CF181D|nr:uncharacterized protein LOC127136278 [Pisum sativum]
MARGRNDRVIVDALEVMAQSLQSRQNQAGDEFCGLGKFQRNNLPTFKARYDLEGAHTWLRENEDIFIVMDCTEVQKVTEFLEKYFPEDVRSKKEIEFPELKHGNMKIDECDAKFEELVKFCP